MTEKRADAEKRTDDESLDKAISRKFALSVYAFLGLLLAIGTLFVIFVGVPDPDEEARKRAEAAQRDQIERQATLPDVEAARLLEQAEAEARRRAAARERELAELERELNARPSDQPTTGLRGRTSSAPSLDPNLLEDLDRIQRELGTPPRFETPRATPLPGSGTSGGATGMGIFEDREGIALLAPSAQAEVTETIRPRTTPARVVHRGVMLRAVLASRIDTRNEGPIIATITRDVYDTVTTKDVLIPRGARLVGTYSTSVDPGVDRITVTFDHIAMPDGRTIPLPSMPAAAPDGTIGVAGDYKSNLLQAIGPAFVVAAIGQWIDRRNRPDNSTAIPGQTVVQSQTVLEQVVPELSRAVQQRYAGARPYFIAEPGQEIRIVVTKEIEIPTT
jgi:type IV secretion system protein VirB10